jgi:hypothetical protein
MNPLGVRALYLGSSTYRIHGTDAPWTIGSAVSKGCIRMYNQDVQDLFPRATVGAKVTVTYNRFDGVATSSGNGAGTSSGGGSFFNFFGGDDTPPDELNHLTGIGEHFGYPYCHAGSIADPEFGRRRSCAQFTPPAQRLGPHVAADAGRCDLSRHRLPGRQCSIYRQSQGISNFRKNDFGFIRARNPHRPNH